MYSGDIISTGTPNNVLAKKDGDKIGVEIEEIGMRLTNYLHDPKVHM